MEKIKEIDIKFASFSMGYEFRIPKFTTEKEWNLCANLEDILREKYKYDCDIHNLDDIGFVLFNVFTRNDSPMKIRERIAHEINKLITKQEKEVSNGED